MAHHASVSPGAKGKEKDASTTDGGIQPFYLGSIPAEIHQPDINGKKAALFVLNKPFRRGDAHNPVNDMVQHDLKWESLQTRRAHARLGMLYKIAEGLLEVPTSYHPVPRSEHHANRFNSRQFTTLDPTVDTYKFAFLLRIVALNNLPGKVVLAELVEAFHRRL